MSFRLSAGAAALASIFSLPSLYAAELQVADTVVTASRTEQQLNDVIGDVSVISEEQILKAGQTSLVELLAMQAGIEVSHNGGVGKSSNVYIRGANPVHTVVLLDGMRINSATSGTTSLENIPLNQIERVEILRGPASSLYGADAIGGVIQIFTKSANGKPKINATVGLGTYGTAWAAQAFPDAWTTPASACRLASPAPMVSQQLPTNALPLTTRTMMATTTVTCPSSWRSISMSATK